MLEREFWALERRMKVKELRTNHNDALVQVRIPMRVS